MNKFKTYFLNDDELPLVIEPEDVGLEIENYLDLVKQNQEILKEKILTYGGLLFRNFPVENENDFSNLIRSLNTGGFIDYIGGDSPRNKITDGIYTSTEAPPWLKIPLHNELSFVKNHPKHIYFYCHIPPEEKGETIIGDARKIYRSIDSGIKERFCTKGLKYVSRYYHESPIMDFINRLQPCHKSWKQVFETEDRNDVERKCRENDFQFKWNKNQWIEVSQLRPAVSKHPETNEDVWFNQVHLFDFNPKLLGWWRYVGAKIFYMKEYTRLHEVFFGDGTRIPREEIYHVLNVLDQHTIAFPWKKGDVMVLDNVLSMHGRAPFSGKRRVMTAMTG